MIYLIRVRYEDVTLLKVGYAKDIKKRLGQYTTENPLFELLDYREGDRRLESFLHDMFKEYKFEKGQEWFYYNDYIVDNFHSDFKESILIEKIKKKMDKSRVFSGKLRLYCKFKEKYPEIDFIVERFQPYIEILGFDRCRELGYKENLLYKDLSNSGYFDDSRLADEDELILEDFLDNQFYKANYFCERMRLYCEFSDKYKDNPYIMEGLYHRVIDPRFLQYYRYYGTKGCSARKYQDADLYRGLVDDSRRPKLDSLIYEKFKSGDKLPKSNIKEILGEMYRSLGISKTAKASDLGEYFKLSKTNVTTPEGVKNGFKLGEKLM